MPTDRIEFSPETKRVIAARAGYRCSMPTCGQVTVGPGLSPDKVTSVGIASHIYSASPGGPRGQNGLSTAQLASPENGIWLCRSHGDLVDKNDGADFSAPLLQSYKALQEGRTARELKGLHSPIHWLEQVIVRWNPLFEQDTTIRFGKLTVVTGPNSSGKSALCDWIAGFGDQAMLWRWIPRSKQPGDLDVELRYYRPQPVSIRLRIHGSDQLAFSVDGQPAPIQPLPLHFVFLHEEWPSDSTRPYDDVELIGRFLNIDPKTLPNLFPLIDSRGLGLAHNLRFSDESWEDENTDHQITARFLKADVKGTLPDLTFRGLSHGEQQFVLIELAFALANYSAQFAPTMLILDGGMHRFDSDTLASLVAKLVDQQLMFQTLMVLPTRQAVAIGQQWAGWTVAHLQYQRGNKATIRQGGI